MHLAEDTSRHATASVPSLRGPSPEFLDLVPRVFARRHLLLSCGRTSTDSGVVESVRYAHEPSPSVRHNLAVRLGCSIEWEQADPETLAKAIDESYASRKAETADSRVVNPDDQVIEIAAPSSEHSLDAAIREVERDLLSTDNKAPLVQFVDTLLFEAITRGVSDVHIQPLESVALIRFRLDGTLVTAKEISVELAPSIVSRVKVMAKMDIAERRVPQDGRAHVTIGRRTSTGQRRIDLRVSTLPTAYGERLVMRLLDPSKSDHLASFEALGMPEDVQNRLLASASRSSGIVLVTGPTGSGKTTTLYATLRWLAGGGHGSTARDLNIMTIEDPIEYELGSSELAISQAQVNTKKGVSFASGLRHILRQDPDVVMVGEIRDAETARIAIQASLTGHLVFSTLHTNDAASAITRLADLGIERYLISASISAVLAQRLIRLSHQSCSGRGCPDCLHTGFTGRQGLFELIVINDVIREQIASAASDEAIRRTAAAAGTRSLTHEGQQLVQRGLTTLDEVLRVTGGAGDDLA
ncbi:MAG: GspE/PulE family protein [Phycisphaerales bacterium JB065]